MGWNINITLKCSAIIEWKIQLKRSSVKVMYLRDWISNLIKSICLCHYNSKAIVQRPRYPKRTKWTDLGRRQKWKIKKRPFYKSARRVRTHDGRHSANGLHRNKFFLSKTLDRRIREANGFRPRFCFLIHMQQNLEASERKENRDWLTRNAAGMNVTRQ